jgi:hypothetical protein
VKIVTVNEKLKAPAELCCLGLEKDADCLPSTCDWLCKETGHSSLKRKHAYYGQVQLGMAILNVQSCDLVIYSPKSKSFATIVVPFDVQFATELFKIISYKYFNNMLHFVCKP